MECSLDDNADDKQLKRDVFGVYNHTLDERDKRKNFVIEHNLMDLPKPKTGGVKKKKPEVKNKWRRT